MKSSELDDVLYFANKYEKTKDEKSLRRLSLLLDIMKVNAIAKYKKSK